MTVQSIASSHCMSPCLRTPSSPRYRSASTHTFDSPTVDTAPPSELSPTLKITPELLKRVQIVPMATSPSRRNSSTSSSSPSLTRFSDGLRDRIQQETSTPLASSPIPVSMSSTKNSTQNTMGVRLSNSLMSRLETTSSSSLVNFEESTNTAVSESRHNDAKSRPHTLSGVRLGPGVIDRVESVVQRSKPLKPSVRATSSLARRETIIEPETTAHFPSSNRHLVTSSYIESLALSADVRERIRSIQ